MKGLFVKDLYMIKKQLYFVYIVYFFFIVLFAFSKANMFLLIFPVLFLTSSLINLLYYDDLYKWNILEYTLPVSRKTIVKEKYILVALVLFFSSIIPCIVYYIINKNFIDTLNLFYVQLLLSFIIPTVTLPIYYKLGYGKSRILSMIIAAFVGGISVLFLNTFLLNKMQEFKSNLSNIFYIMFPIIIASLIFISYLISVKVYEKREF